MFVSNEWACCAWAKKPEGKAVKMIVMDEERFGLVWFILIKPQTPCACFMGSWCYSTLAMEFIYKAMDDTEEMIAKNLYKDVSSYKKIWNIIDTKLEL